MDAWWRLNGASQLRATSVPYRCAVIAVLLLTWMWSLPAEAQRLRLAGSAAGAQVRLLNGKTITLLPPISLRGAFHSSRLSIHGLSLGAVDRITATGSAPGTHLFSIRLRDGTTIGAMTARRGSTIGGKGSWGPEHIALARVASIVLRHTQEFRKRVLKPSWRATMVDGSTFPIVTGWGAIRPALHGYLGRVRMGFRANRVKRLVFSGGRAKVVGYDGRVLAEGWRPQASSLDSRTWYGFVRFDWSRIGALESLIVEPPAEPKSVYKITLADGRSAFLHGARIGGFSAWVEDVQFRFQRGPITGMVRSADGKTAELAMDDGRKMRITDFRNYSGISISAEDGDLSSSWINLTRIERIKAEKESSRPFEPQWQLVTKQGLTLPVRHVRVYRGVLWRRSAVTRYRARKPTQAKRMPAKRTGPAKRKAPDIVARKLNWFAVREVKAGPNGLRVVVGDKSWISLRAAITAQSRYGTVRVPANSVAALTKLEGAGLRSNAKFALPPKGRLKIEDGREFSVQSMDFEGGRRVHHDRRFWGHRMLVTRVPPVEYWSLVDTVLRRGIGHDEAGHVLGRPFAGAQAVPLTGVRGLRFTSTAGAFFVPAALIGPYRTTATPTKPPHLPTSVRLRVYGSGTKSEPLDVGPLTFARYPSRGYSGYYTKSSYPFQWHRSRQLYFRRRDTGSQLAIDLTLLQRIEIMGRYVNGRPAKVTNRQGDTITGWINPGLQGRGRGVARWNARNEGLLGRLADGSYLFVRFTDVTRIDLEYPGTKK